jgi:hypothetical protein
VLTPAASDVTANPMKKECFRPELEFICVEIIP